MAALAAYQRESMKAHLFEKKNIVTKTAGGEKRKAAPVTKTSETRKQPEALRMPYRRGGASVIGIRESVAKKWRRNKRGAS